jgi:hypothetical protein
MYEANYYPMSSAAVIENCETRITLLSGQPCGAASELAGRLEVMIDRTVGNDDGKGLPYGEAAISRPSVLQYVLMVESKKEVGQKRSSIAYHSLIAQQALEQLFYPPILFLASETAGGTRNFLLLSHISWSIFNLHLKLVLRKNNNLQYLLQRYKLS